MKNDNAPITVKLGYRYLKESQEIELRKLLEDEYELHIEKLSSELTLKSQVIKKYQDTQIKTYSRVVRSGQTIQVEGSLLLIGDVNPGGKVEASGNIFILGELLGIAHAGIDRKSTRLNSSHVAISYAVFCLKQKIVLEEQLIDVK